MQVSYVRCVEVQRLGRGGRARDMEEERGMRRKTNLLRSSPKSTDDLPTHAQWKWWFRPRIRSYDVWT